MLRRNQVLSLVCGALTTFAVGCSSSPAPGDTGPVTDAATDITTPSDGAIPDAGPGITYNYVVRTLTIDESDSEDVPHTGFNVDNRVSDGVDNEGMSCQGHVDLFSMIDRDQNATPTCAGNGAAVPPCGGVDNKLPQLASALHAVMASLDLNMTLATEIAAGRLSLMLQLSDVNSLVEDPSVTARIFMAYPTFADCGMLFSNGEYVVAQGSLRPNGTGPADALFQAQGSIVGGRLRIATMPNDLFRLPLPDVNGIHLALDMHSTQVRLSLSDTGGTLGNLGGWVAGNDLMTAIVAAAPQFAGAAPAIIGGMVDIRVNNTCFTPAAGSTPPAFGGISMGLGLTTVPARVSTMPAVAAHPAATCGYRAPAGDAGTGDGG